MCFCLSPEALNNMKLFMNLSVAWMARYTIAERIRFRVKYKHLSKFGRFLHLQLIGPCYCKSEESRECSCIWWSTRRNCLNGSHLRVSTVMQRISRSRILIYQNGLIDWWLILESFILLFNPFMARVKPRLMSVFCSILEFSPLVLTFLSLWMRIYMRPYRTCSVCWRHPSAWSLKSKLLGSTFKWF